MKRAHGSTIAPQCIVDDGPTDWEKLLSSRGCGLVGLDTGRPVEAARDLAGDRFTCPACGGPVLLKRGRVVIAHFAHRPGAECWSEPESVHHLRAQHLLATRFRGHGYRVGSCRWVECSTNSGRARAARTPSSRSGGGSRLAGVGGAGSAGCPIGTACLGVVAWLRSSTAEPLP